VDLEYNIKYVFNSYILLKIKKYKVIFLSEFNLLRIKINQMIIEFNFSKINGF
jgi:hypothetical protein